MTQEAIDARPALEQSVERHELPSGGWVEIRAINTLKAKHGKMVLREMNKPDMDKAMAFGVDMTYGLLSMMILAWYLPYEPDWPVPSLCLMRDPETNCPLVLDELNADDYAALQNFVLPAQRKLFPKPVDPTDAETPGTPGAPASA